MPHTASMPPETSAGALTAGPPNLYAVKSFRPTDNRRRGDAHSPQRTVVSPVRPATVQNERGRSSERVTKTPQGTPKPSPTRGETSQTRRSSRNQSPQPRHASPGPPPSVQVRSSTSPFRGRSPKRSRNASPQRTTSRGPANAGGYVRAVIPRFNVKSIEGKNKAMQELGKVLLEQARGCTLPVLNTLISANAKYLQQAETASGLTPSELYVSFTIVDFVTGGRIDKVKDISVGSV